MKKLAIILTVLIVAQLATSLAMASDTGRYGALAYGEHHGEYNYSYAYNFTSEHAARRAVLKDCKETLHKRCLVITSFKNTCFVTFTNNGHHTMVESKGDLDHLEDHGRALCHHKYGEGCQLITAGCT